MAGAFEIGTIPAISDWEGETLTFPVKRRSGTNDFIMDVKLRPKGKIAIDKAYGGFSYAPRVPRSRRINWIASSRRG